MSQCDSATEDVELFAWNVENLLVRERDGREGLIHFKLGNIVDCQSGLLQRSRNCECRCDTKVDRRTSRVGER